MSKKDEKIVVDKLNERYGFRFKLVEDEFCPYDATDGAFALEIKVRKKFYGDIMIEEIKYDALMDVFRETGLIPIAVQVSDGFYRYVSLLDKFQLIERRAKKTTDFSNNTYSSKVFCVYKTFKELGKL